MTFRDETTDDPVLADVRNFYKVELWDERDCIERMLYAGTSLDKARSIFADYARHRPAARLTIRQRSRVLAQVVEGRWVSAAPRQKEPDPDVVAAESSSG